MKGRLPVLLLLATVLVAGAVYGLFGVGFGEATPEPVDFDDTVTVGLTLEDELRLEASEQSVQLPRVQVFYSKYPYVVGYYGVEQFLTERRTATHEQQFGYPTAMYVTVFDDGPVGLTDENLLVSQGDVKWHAADDAVYVVGSEAETPSGKTVVPFANHEQAVAFSEEYGGSVRSWDGVLDESFDVDDGAVVRERTVTQHRVADKLVAQVRTVRDRPVSVEVTGDNESLQAAIDAAPANTTVHVSEGVYEGPVEIDHPITLRGESGARVEGGGNGTVVNITADTAAVTGLAISGVGDVTPGAGATEGHVHDHGDADEDDAEKAWDAAIEDDYATGDAGIAVDNATHVLIENVSIRTPASGIMLRDSPENVVRNVSIVGNQNYVEAHMGVVAMRSPGVVEHSVIVNGLDGVYTHRADGIVIRNNTMADNRMGVHTMHTSGALIAGNHIRDQITAGIFVMTGPERNGLVANEIRNSSKGIDIGGSDSYVADNVVVGNEVGLRIETASSIFEGNVVADNEFGVSTWALLPTNRVVRNDFVGNYRHVGRTTGPMRVWTYEGTGNYWQGAVGTTDGTTLDRRYTPTNGLDRRLHQTAGTPALAQAPALDALTGLENTVSGSREGEIVDNAPLCDPVNTEWFREQNRTETEPTCDGTDAVGSGDADN